MEDSFGSKPLFYVFGHDNELASLLIDHGADPNDFGFNGTTPSLMAKWHHPEILIDYPENTKLNDELLLLKILSNSWWIDADLKVVVDNKEHVFEAGGLFSIYSNIVLGMLLRRFHDKDPDPDVEEMLKMTLQKLETDNLTPQELLQRFKDGENDVFDSGWEEHATSLMILGAHAVQSNRGMMGKGGGLHAKKIDRASAPCVEEDFEIIQKNYRADFWDNALQKQYWQTGLLERLGAVKEDLISEILNEIVLTEQQMGNCWWISPKTSLLVGFALMKMHNANISPHMSEQTKKNRLPASNARRVSKIQGIFRIFTL